MEVVRLAGMLTPSMVYLGLLVATAQSYPLERKALIVSDYVYLFSGFSVYCLSASGSTSVPLLLLMCPFLYISF